ncbi:MAG TPA: SWIM zinc finger family protein [Tepidisphaeraceae bacterium]|nr:SWIM zinc finger family protein [Tepidisphaeraceae bacterium]
MATGWNRDRVLQLAPDAASAKAGQELANARKWSSIGGDEQAIWGLCQGSGKNPYQTIIDLGEPAFKCSCPSRKFPCKHGLGLLLQFAAAPEGFTRAERPAWVAEWMTTRQERAQKKAEAAAQPPKPVDAEAQAERRAKRHDRVAAGLASLRTWIDDIVRDGIAAVQPRGYSFFDEPARRMIDAQAPGAARMIADLGVTMSSGGDWHEPFLRQLSSLHLLVEAHAKIDQLPSETREDVLARLGIAVPQEEVLATPPLQDTWQVTALEVDVDERLRVQKTWLFGVNSRRIALILHFAHDTAAFEANFAIGSQFDGEICRFPGTGIRAAVKSRGSSTAIEKLAGFDDLDAACDAFSQMLGRQPWLEPVALPLRNVVPTLSKNSWSVIDATGHALPATMPPGIAWQATAISGGHPIGIVATFDGQTLRPLTLFTEREVIPTTHDRAMTPFSPA